MSTCCALARRRPDLDGEHPETRRFGLDDFDLVPCDDALVHRSFRLDLRGPVSALLAGRDRAEDAAGGKRRAVLHPVARLSANARLVALHLLRPSRGHVPSLHQHGRGRADEHGDHRSARLDGRLRPRAHALPGRFRRDRVLRGRARDRRRRRGCPLAVPGLVATFLFVLVFAWNEYLIALFLTSANAQTLPLTVAAQNATRGPQWWYMSVLILIMIGPVIAMAIALERFIARGLLVGAVKG